MLLRLAALGALGYAGYKYYEKNSDQVDGAVRRLSSGGSDESEASLPGGPLSDRARLVGPDDAIVS